MFSRKVGEFGEKGLHANLAASQVRTPVELGEVGWRISSGAPSFLNE